jgi:hypothetical protein
MNSKILFLITFIFAAPFMMICKGQHNLGIATSDNSVINSLYLNPANVAGCKEKIVVSLFSINVGVDNSLGTFSKIGDLSNSLKSNNVASVFQNSGTQNFNMLVPSAEVRGPGILVRIDDKQSIALTTRIRVMNQFNNFDQSLYTAITNPNYVSNGNYTYNAKNFNWTAHLWSDIGLTYGRVLMENDNSSLKAGVTLRYLGGIAYLGFKGSNVDVTYNTGKDSFYAANSDIEYASNILTTTDAVKSGLNSSDLLNRFFGAKDGHGLGADLGVVYIYNPGGNGKKGTNKNTGSHKLSLSASVTDIGAINYKENNSIVNVSGNGYITGTGIINNLNNWTSFRNYMVKQGYTADTASQSTKLYMPTALVLGADYQIYKQYYVNATYINNLANRQNYGNSYYNQFTITPRYDTRLFTIGLPITYSALASDVKIGLGFRVSGFFFGSDDMLALVSDHQHGFDVYAGGYIPIR